MDVLSASYNDAKIAWYENLFPSCDVPSDLSVTEIGFGGNEPKVGFQWLNPNFTTDCKVRAGLIDLETLADPQPNFTSIEDTRILHNTDGDGLDFNIRLFDNPYVDFIPGAYYGYEVKCQCSDATGYSYWSGLSSSSVFQVPLPPPGMELGATTKTLNTFGESISLFPNPFTETAILDLGEIRGLVNLEIYDALGKLQRSETLNTSTSLSAGLQSGTLNLSKGNLKSGNYLLRITTEQGTSVLKFRVE